MPDLAWTHDRVRRLVADMSPAERQSYARWIAVQESSRIMKQPGDVSARESEVMHTHEWRSDDGVWHIWITERTRDAKSFTFADGETCSITWSLGFNNDRITRQAHGQARSVEAAKEQANKAMVAMRQLLKLEGNVT